MSDAASSAPPREPTAPWGALLVGLVAVWFLKSEFERTTPEPAPLPAGVPNDAEPPATRDVVSAPRPGGAETAATDGEERPGVEAVVRVTTPEGKPLAGRGVGLRAAGRPGRRTRFTDATGEARLPFPVEGVDAGAAAWEVFLRDPGRPDVAAPVSKAAPTATLFAPEGVVARLEICDAAGLPVSDAIAVAVEVVADPPTEPLDFVVDRGLAVIAGLPPHTPVRFVARPNGLLPAACTAWFAPDPSGAAQDVSLPLEKPAGEVVAEFPDLPAGSVLRASAWYGGRTGDPAFTVYGTADDAGRLRAAFPAGSNVVLEIGPVERRGPAADAWYVRRLGARSALTLTAPRRDAPRFGGRVRRSDESSAGGPAAGALVLAAPTARRAGASDETPVRCTTSDAEGRFVLRGPPTDGPWRAQARFVDPDTGRTALGAGPETYGVPDGDVDLALDAGGVVRGRLDDLPPEFLGGRYGPTVALAVEDADGVVVGYGTPALDGAFEIDAPAGLFDVRITAPGLRPTLVAAVLAGPEAPTEDPRLRGLRLLPSFAVAELRVERAEPASEEGRLLVGAVVTARFSDPRASEREPLVAETESLGAARLRFEPGSEPEFVVTWEDRRRGDLALRPASAKAAGRSFVKETVRLRRGAAVTFEGGESLPDPPPDVEAVFVLVREGPTDGVEPPTQRPLRLPWRKALGPPRFASAPNGVWRARLDVIREGRGRRAAGADLGRCVVRDADTAVVASCDAAAFAAALAAE